MIPAIRFQASGIRHPVSGIRYQASGIRHQAHIPPSSHISSSETSAVMTDFLPTYRIATAPRRASRRAVRRIPRRRLRPGSFRPVRRITAGRHPNYLRIALRIFRLYLKSRKRLAKLVPEFFDPAVIRMRERLVAQERVWKELLEPVLDRVYGPGQS